MGAISETLNLFTFDVTRPMLSVGVTYLEVRIDVKLPPQRCYDSIISSW